MNEIAFVERREPDWKRLSVLCDKADGSLNALTPEEFREFVRLYRKASADLALVRTKSSNRELATYLNDLVARTYGILYRAPRAPFWKAVTDSLALSARTVRRQVVFVALSAALFFGSAFYSFGLMTVLPQTRSHFVPPDVEESFEGWKQGRFEERSSPENVFMTAFYASNNPRVSVIAGAVAASTFGVGTVVLLYTNGALLGSLAKELEPNGLIGHLLISVAPHGVTEISGIIIAGAAGFVMGWALIHPGRRRRGEALFHAGKDAMVLLCTSVVMMFIAAPIEGFFSFNAAVPDGARAAVALVSAILWGVFWFGYAREEIPQALPR